MTTAEFWTAVAAIAACVYTIVTAVSLLFIARQIVDTRRFSQAQFINDLEKEFNSFASIFDTLRDPAKLDALADTGRDHSEFYSCLNFFERVNTLLDTGVVSRTLVDRVLGRPFFMIINTPQVQDAFLYTAHERFPEVFALHQQLAVDRHKHGRGIPLAATDLATRNPARYAANITQYAQMR